jgi:hypothetical protein
MNQSSCKSGGKVVFAQVEVCLIGYRTLTLVVAVAQMPCRSSHTEKKPITITRDMCLR